MKLYKQAVIVLAITFVAGIILVPADSNARGKGYGRNLEGSQQADSTIITNLPMQNLSLEEEVGLRKMREEEKLARDVYQTLYDRWQLPIFANIARSEQQHMDAVKILLDKYNRLDPVTDNTIGVFTDHELQDLYTALINQGQKSLIEALEVGATIEDLDIKDLYDLLEQTDNRDIQTVYQNLAKGSRNHLRAFTSQLSLGDVTYEAQFLTPEQISDIIAAPKERGRVDENGIQISGSSRSGKKYRHSGSQGGNRF